MLYVFHVDVGRMLNFDMTVALSSVENLKSTIERLHGIPAANIVLLVSGGEMLTHSTQVSYYSAGTDTNPIYMFLTGDLKTNIYSLAVDSTEIDLKEQVDRSLELPVANETVMRRAQLAQRMYEVARDEDRLCERLVHEQHLQQQGWSAVVANMEDLTDEFCQRFRSFCEIFERHLEKRSNYVDMLKHFGDDLEKLSRIPILPGLMPLVDLDFHGFDEFLDNDDVFSKSHQQESVLNQSISAKNETNKNNEENNAPIAITASNNIVDQNNETHNIDIAKNNGQQRDELVKNSQLKNNFLDEKLEQTKAMTNVTTSTTPNKKLKMGSEFSEDVTMQTSNISSNNSNSMTRRRLNLLQWIISKENRNVLKTMSDECIQGLSTFNEEIYEKLKIEVENIIKVAEQSDVKEIKGLGERLCKLEEIKYKIKNMVRDQKELSTAIQQNQNRFQDLRDLSILPDLCESHRSQLVVMLQNYQKIRDHRRLIVKAKDELGGNLHTRLKRIVFIENAMSEFDNSLLFYRRCLGRAERHIHIIEQIHQAPNMYVAAVTEVLRRKIFSTEFRLWACKLAEDFDIIHSEEIKRRQDFNVKFSGHFLNILFPGMQDMPPAFANDNPPLLFDAHLPNITHCDIHVLNTHLPEMASQIQLPDMEPVIYFFVSRSGAYQKKRLEEIEKRIQQQQDQCSMLDLTVEEHVQKYQKKIEQSEDLLSPQRNQLAVKSIEELETDVEIEFEQVITKHTQDDLILNKQTAGVQESKILKKELISKGTITKQLYDMETVSTITEENMDSIRCEVQRLREILGLMSKVALDCIQSTRNDLSSFRIESQIQRDDLQKELCLLKSKWDFLNNQNVVQKHQQEKIRNNLQQEVQCLNDNIESHKCKLKEALVANKDLQLLADKCKRMEQELEKCLQKIKQIEEEKELAVTLAREEVAKKYQNEMESLRRQLEQLRKKEQQEVTTNKHKKEVEKNLDVFSINQFVDNCTQKSDRENVNLTFQNLDNYIGRCHHETILDQQRLNHEIDKKKAIKDAIQLERSIWQSKIFPLNSQSMMAQVNVLHVLEEKERQLDQLREKDLMMTKENYQLKTRLDALTNDEGNSWLKEKIEYLNRDKCRLEEELHMEKLKRLDIESIAASNFKGSCELPIAISTSTLSRAKSLNSAQKYVVLESCGKGDIVFVVWNMQHCQFMVVQQSPNLYFVHGDSLQALNLHLPSNQTTDGYVVGNAFTTTTTTTTGTSSLLQTNVSAPVIPLPFYALGRVVEKEYCQARKEENRYRVVRGAKFYRIKLAPITISNRSSGSSSRRDRCDLSSTSISISRSISQCKETQTAAHDVDDDNPKGSHSSNVRLFTIAPMLIDTVDAVEASPESCEFKGKKTNTAVSPQLDFKEHSMSFGSVTEEDEEPISLISNRCHYTSVSEEDEATLTALTTLTNMQQSVITEQPTLASEQKLQSDSVLVSKYINDIKTINITNHNTNSDPTNTTKNSTNSPCKHNVELKSEIELKTNMDNKFSPGHFSSRLNTSSLATEIDITASIKDDNTGPMSLLLIDHQTKQTTAKYNSEDSDEYRSLEAKDDDFLISE